jgi:hypothetical protein
MGRAAANSHYNNGRTYAIIPTAPEKHLPSWIIFLCVLLSFTTLLFIPTVHAGIFYTISALLLGTGSIYLEIP